jgi:predicted glutamine amidotransferase
MCGLVAMISKRKFGFVKNEIDSFTQMLYADQLRGKDGTGIFYNSKKESFNNLVLKAAIPSSIFIDQKEYEDSIDTIYKESSYVVGHNRAGTKGGVSTKNTHPFREKHITLVHNGTLLKHDNLHPTYESDSKAICYGIATNGAEETLKEVDGAFALIWADAKEKTINFCRNAQRPLYIVESADCFFFSSEEGLAKWILGRNNITITSSKMLDTHKIYSFPFDDVVSYTEKVVEFYKYVYKQTMGFFGDSKRKKNKYHPYMEYNEEGAEYNSTEEWPWNPDGTPKAGHTIYQEPLKIENKSKGSFAFGQDIRFRAGAFHQGKHSSYLEGDLLINQELDPSLPTVGTDFEDEFRIKVYGKVDELSKFIFEKNLIGKVITTSFVNAKESNYTVSQIKLFNGISSKSKLVECEFCSKNFPEKELTLVDECKLCTTCASSLSHANCQH